MMDRKASIVRTTDRSEVRIVFNLDGRGTISIQTGNPFLDHMLGLFAKHGSFDLEIQFRPIAADGEDGVEEIGFCIGLALDKTLGERKGIARSGHCCAPVSEHLARAVVEISGHPCLVYRVRAAAPSPGSLKPAALEKFWSALAFQARLTLHLELLYGGDGLPAFEAVFKAAARALNEACRPGSGRAEAPTRT